MVVLCGGNDLGGQLEPEAVADRLVDRFRNSGSHVVFLTELMRWRGSPRVPENYPWLLQRFNGQLKARCSGVAHLSWWYLRKIGRTKYLSDGVHLGDRGQLTLFLSIKMAIGTAVRALNSE